MKQYTLLIILLVLFFIPLAHAAANLEVSAFSCSPDEVKINDQFSCSATVANTGDATGSLTTATLYPDSSSWMESSSYPETVSTSITSGSSATVVFDDLKGKKSGNNGFARILLDDVTDTFVADNAVKVNVINVAITSSSSDSSAISGASVSITGQATAGGDMDLTLSISLSGSGCSIGNQDSSASQNDLTDGQTFSKTWTVTLGSASCTATISGQATSNPDGTATKTDSSSSSITCSDCSSGSGGGSGSSGSSGGGGGGGGGGSSSGASSNSGNDNTAGDSSSGESKNRATDGNDKSQSSDADQQNAANAADDQKETSGLSNFFGAAIGSLGNVMDITNVWAILLLMAGAALFIAFVVRRFRQNEF